MAHKPMPKIVGSEEDFSLGFKEFMDLHGSTYQHIGAFSIKPPSGEGFNLKLGNSEVRYSINKWKQQRRYRLVKNGYGIEVKKLKKGKFTFEKWIKKEVKSIYFSHDMKMSQMDEIFWKKLMPSKHFAPNYATGIHASVFPSK